MQNLITYVLFNFRFVNSGSISPYLIRMRENTDKNNSKYEHILRSVKAFKKFLTCVAKVKKSDLTLIFVFASFVNINKEEEW